MQGQNQNKIISDAEQEVLFAWRNQVDDQRKPLLDQLEEEKKTNPKAKASFELVKLSTEYQYITDKLNQAMMADFRAKHDALMPNPAQQG